jgi:hypothetical protein
MDRIFGIIGAFMLGIVICCTLPTDTAETLLPMILTGVFGIITGAAIRKEIK